MQPTYRPFTQQHLPRSPHVAATARRGIGPIVPGPHPQGVLAPAQIQAQQAAQIQANDRMKLRSRKPTDKNLPDGIEDLIIGDGVQKYRELREIERRLDSTMTRKRLDIQDSVNRNVQRFKTLRIWISNTVEDQAWQSDSLHIDTLDYNTKLDPSYRVKIEGRLLDDEDDATESDEENNSSDEDKMIEKKDSRKYKPVTYKFSHYFKAISVDFDRQSNSDGGEQKIEWKKPLSTANTASLPAAADFDQLEFKRRGDENTNITVNLFRDETPERFSLQPILADILGTDVATRAEALMGIWDYIKLMGLQDDEEKRAFDCDQRLKMLIQREKGYIPYLAESINQHIEPLPPMKLPYTIRVDKEFHDNPQPTIYDVRVLVNDPLKSAFLSYLTNTSYAQDLRDISILNDHLALLIQRIINSKSKHTFLDALSKNPIQFINRWLSSQKRDLEIIAGEATRGGGEDASGDEWRKGGKDSIWASDLIRESVNFMVSQKMKI
ncbi:hypothetical protein K3495_g7300 [Podosphaera aphanis]|nr:hypothetical protein K3495_g7300 [Podosphaera aphanis]